MNVRFPLDRDTVIENTRFEFRSDEGIDLVATSGTPERAEEMAQLEAKLIEDLSIRRSGTAGGRFPEIPRLVTRLGDRSTPAAERRRLQARLQAILAELDASAPRARGPGRGHHRAGHGRARRARRQAARGLLAQPGAVCGGVAGLALALGLFAALALLSPPAAISSAFPSEPPSQRSRE